MATIRNWFKIQHKLHAFDTPDGALRPADGAAAVVGALFSFITEADLFADDSSLPLFCNLDDLFTSGVLALVSVTDMVTDECEFGGEFSRSSVCINSGNVILSKVSSSSSLSTMSKECPVVRASSATICKWTATVFACSHSSATSYGDSALSLRNVFSLLSSLQSNRK